MRTRSSADGTYELAELPPGSYRVSVAVSCCEFASYSKDSVAVREGEAVKLDIVLEPVELGVEGDDPAKVNAELLARQVIPDLPVPRTADGLPDLSGVWLISDDP